MTNFAARLAGIATLALAALPVAAISTVAHAAPAVRVADLDLASIEGVATYHQRVAAVTRQMCADERILSRQQACRTGIRSEMQEKLAALQNRQTQMAAR